MDAFTAGEWRDPDSNRGHHDFQTSPIDRLRLETAANRHIRFDNGASQNSLFAVIPRRVSATSAPPWPQHVPPAGTMTEPALPELFQSVRGRSLLEAGKRDHGGNTGACSSSGGGARDGPIEALASVEDQDRTAVAGGGEVSGAGPEHQGVTIGPGWRADRSDGTMRCA
jgi:hypothetical protein